MPPKAWFSHAMCARSLGNTTLTLLQLTVTAASDAITRKRLKSSRRTSALHGHTADHPHLAKPFQRCKPLKQQPGQSQPLHSNTLGPRAKATQAGPLGTANLSAAPATAHEAVPMRQCSLCPTSLMSSCPRRSDVWPNSLAEA